MKVTRLITTELEVDLDISGATLLTVEEAKKLPEGLRKYDGWWWLQSRGYGCRYVKIVYNEGDISDVGRIVDFDGGGVRPALIISNIESTNFKIGHTFLFGEKIFKIISKDRAFCLEDIGTCVFKKDWQASDANDYEKSDIKKYVDEWFEKSRKGE